MRVSIKEQPCEPDVSVTIACPEKTPRIDALKRHIQAFDEHLTCYDGARHVRIPIGDVLYFQSTDKKTFACTERATLEIPHALFLLEERLAEYDFVRIAKHTLLNFEKVARIEPEMNGRLLLTLCNKERLLASRFYAKGIRRKLGMR